MKKILFLLFVVATFSVQAQEFHFGGGLALGTKSGINLDSEDGIGIGFGINAFTEYSFTEKISVNGGFTYFIPSKADIMMGLEMKLTAYQIVADAHYNFLEGDFGLYGLAGLNFSSAGVTVSDDKGKSESTSDSKVGLDLGVGAAYNVLFGELKYDTAMEQIQFTVGVKF